jgi:hypothetical protein
MFPNQIALTSFYFRDPRILPSQDLANHAPFVSRSPKELETSLEPFLTSSDSKTLRLNIRMRIQRRITQIAATREQVVMVVSDGNLSLSFRRRVPVALREL